MKFAKTNQGGNQKKTFQKAKAFRNVLFLDFRNIITVYT